MEKTLHNGDKLIIEKISPRIGNIHRGDIVTIYTEKVNKKTNPLIKRVIGIEGDHVEILDGKVFVNEKEVKEDYINGDNTLEVNTNNSDVKVEKGYIYFLGDNRVKDMSTDSRDIGQEKVENISGKAFLRFFPFNSFRLF